MNYQGCKRKFAISAFVAKFPAAAKNAAKAQKVQGEVLDHVTQTVNSIYRLTDRGVSRLFRLGLRSRPQQATCQEK